MNVFIIPSWYPSADDPLPGIFFKEQSEALSLHAPSSRFGMSVWGQNDARLLVYARRPLSALLQFARRKPDPYRNEIRSNFVEYGSPAYTWTARIHSGNRHKIIQANEANLLRFESEFGQADLIHAHVGYPAGYIAYRLSQVRRLPYLITEHMGPFPFECFLHKDMLNDRLRKAYQGAAQNIAVSAALKQKMQSYGVKRIAVVPNLVKQSMLDADLCTEKISPFTFLALGRLVPQKGTDILLRAFAKMKAYARLHIGGSGDHQEEYQALARELHVADRVTWLGMLSRAEVQKVLDQCSAFVLPSQHESQGVVLIEAMARGKPVVATSCGGPEEFVHAENGYLTPVDDVDALAEAMDKMMRNIHHFNAEKIRASCAKRFSPAVVTQAIMDVYQRLVGGVV